MFWKLWTQNAAAAKILTETKDVFQKSEPRPAEPRVFDEKPSPLCTLFRIWMIWLDSFDQKWNSHNDGMVWLLSSDKRKAPYEDNTQHFS